jgi:hypothetical protein
MLAVRSGREEQRRSRFAACRSRPLHPEYMLLHWCSCIDQNAERPPPQAMGHRPFETVSTSGSTFITPIPTTYLPVKNQERRGRTAQTPQRTKRGGTTAKFSTRVTTTIFEDNGTCIRMSEAESPTPRTPQYINARCHWMREAVVHDKSLRMVHCSTTEMVADVLTKPLGSFEVARFHGPMSGTKPIPHPPVGARGVCCFTIHCLTEGLLPSSVRRLGHTFLSWGLLPYYMLCLA